MVDGLRYGHVTIKCNPDNKDNCLGCPFRNETELGMTCNVDSKYWWTTFQIYVKIKKGKKHGVKRTGNNTVPG